MTAVIICTPAHLLDDFDREIPADLISLKGKPFIQHLVEYLALCGIRTFEFILRHSPERIEEFLASGARWGCNFQFHCAPDEVAAYRLARTLCASLNGAFVLGHGDRIPAEISDQQQFGIHNLPDVLCSRDNGRLTWRGWLWSPDERAASLLDGDCFDAIEARLLHAVDHRTVRPQMIESWLSAESASGLLHSSMFLLNFRRLASVEVPAITGRQVAVGRNCSIHRTAQLTEPFSIGNNCQIGSDARIGPYAMIEDNCIVETRTRVCNALIAPGTYVGRELELDHVIVDKNRLVNISLGVSYTIPESFLLGRLDQFGAVFLTRLLSRKTAILLLLIFCLLFVTAFLFERRHVAA